MNGVFALVTLAFALVLLARARTRPGHACLRPSASRACAVSSAGITITAFKLAKMHGRRLGDADSDDMWEYVNGVMAVYMYRTFLRLKGTWVKTGQYIGSRADIMPQAITDEFAKLQDAVPPSPFASIKETIETSFDKPLSSVFDDFQETALAAASIAQVRVV